MKKADAKLKAGLIVDQLGHLKAQVAKLTQTEGELKVRLREIGLKEAEGELFRATVGDDGEYEARDQAFKDLIERLVLEHTSPQYRAAHTEKKVREGAVRVVARIRKEAA